MSNSCFSKFTALLKRFTWQVRDSQGASQNSTLDYSKSEHFSGIAVLLAIDVTQRFPVGAYKEVASLGNRSILHLHTDGW